MNFWKNTLGVLLAVVVLGACNKDNDETATYTVALRAESTKSAVSWNITSATAILTELELESDDDDDDNGDDDSDEIDLEGRYEVNLLTGASNPPLPEMEVGTGVYEELEITLGDDDAADEVALIVEAEWEFEGVTQVVSILVEGELEYEVESDAGITFTDDTEKELMVYINIKDALQALDLTSAQVGANNTINITQESNPVLYANFISALNFELDD